MVASEWITPGPSTLVQGLLPADGTLLTQWISSLTEALKLAVRRFPVIEKPVGLMAAGSVFIAMSQVLKGSTLATFTR
jgi:hypothetical protein